MSKKRGGAFRQSKKQYPQDIIFYANQRSILAAYTRKPNKES
jgi:hypothetical protein